MVELNKPKIIRPRSWSRFLQSNHLPSHVVLFFVIFLGACGENRVELAIQNANDEWIKGHNHSAVQLFKSVLEKNPEDRFAEEILFRLGEIYYFSLRDDHKAIGYFLDVLQLNKNGRFGYDAQKYIARIVENNIKDYDQAIIEYQKLIDNFDRSPGEKARFQFQIASNFFKKQDYEQAIVEMENLLEDYPGSLKAEEALFRVTEILYTLNRCDEIKDRVVRFKKEFPMSLFMAEMEYVTASCLEDEGKLKEALKAFKALEGRYGYPALLTMKIEGISKRIKKVG